MTADQIVAELWDRFPKMEVWTFVCSLRGHQRALAETILRGDLDCPQWNARLTVPAIRALQARLRKWNVEDSREASLVHPEQVPDDLALDSLEALGCFLSCCIAEGNGDTM